MNYQAACRGREIRPHLVHRFDRPTPHFGSCAMPKKTKSSAPTPATSPIGSSDPTTPTRRDSLHSDPTMQLHMDDLQIETPDASPRIDAGETQLLSQQNLRDAGHQELLDGSSPPTRLAIPSATIERREE